MEESKVYALTDERGRIIRIEGGCSVDNIKDPSRWTLIDSGYGDRYELCQNNYLPLFTEDGIPRYALVDGAAAERSREEIEADRGNLPEPAPTLDARVDALEKTDDDIILLMAELIGG